jgi:16S rRNA (cytosine967-C5)-methyltransferase
MPTADNRSISPARRTAFDVLTAVAEGAFASDELLQRGAALPAADAGLATELVMGCLRRQRQLDAWIGQLSGRDPDRLDPPVRIALRLGVYQLWRLDRVPRYAAVSESVTLARYAREGSAAGFVNAVLRKFQPQPPRWSPAVEHNLPDWLWEKWVSEFGPARARRIGEASLQPPETWIRVPPGREPEALALGAEPTHIPGCYLAHGETGPFRQQDIGSQSIVARHLHTVAGMRVLDLAAAPGNKSRQILETEGVRLVAADSSWKRLASMAGLPCPRIQLDGTRPLPFPPIFDRVLLDAPCSGTGTVGRNPEIRWRVTEEDVGRHSVRQRAMLREALAVLRPGGRLVYSTCSLEREENEAVVDAALAATGSVYKLLAMERRIPGEDPGDGFFMAVLGSKKPSGA